jgi:hypothetical protein
MHSNDMLVKEMFFITAKKQMKAKGCHQISTDLLLTSKKRSKMKNNVTNQILEN